MKIKFSINIAEDYFQEIEDRRAKSKDNRSNYVEFLIRKGLEKVKGEQSERDNDC